MKALFATFAVLLMGSTSFASGVGGAIRNGQQCILKSLKSCPQGPKQFGDLHVNILKTANGTYQLRIRDIHECQVPCDASSPVCAMPAFESVVSDLSYSYVQGVEVLKKAGRDVVMAVPGAVYADFSVLDPNQKPGMTLICN